mgnify:CR=1 FL=1
MEWTDHGFVVGLRPHGENAAIVSVLTEAHGLHAGYLHGGQSRRRRPLVEPGNFVHLDWSGRLSEQLGRYDIELIKGYPSQYMYDPGRLLTIQSACAVIYRSLPERQVFDNIFNGLQALLDNLGGDVWCEAYVIWEIQLLKALAFGLQTDQCALTGKTEKLNYISPRSGRAVAKGAAPDYEDKMLSLPRFLTGNAIDNNLKEALDGLRLSGYFLKKNVFNPLHRSLPNPRVRLFEHISGLIKQEKEATNKLDITEAA